MLVALGDMYLKLNKIDRAQKCYWRAHCVGDLECVAILKLAKFVLTYLFQFCNLTICRIFEKENNGEEAAKCYLKYLEITDARQVCALHSFTRNLYLGD